ncbi:MAG: phosphatase PAP2 family protein [Ignavibacteriaceae bacterium]|nr:phosphatase PAP2 family protein [Ignavibacteriaceae bacterium]
MIDYLYRIDLSIFYFLNHTLSTPALDKFFSLITNVNNWYIAYVILLLISIIKGGKAGRIVAIGVLILIAITDQLSSVLIKDFFQRVRPCNILPDVITPMGRTGTYSFPSTHAFNNFAVATFIVRFFPRLWPALFITAILISLSRIYLGLHYPSDVLGGAIIGSAIGYIFASLVKWIDKRIFNGSKKR